MILKDKTLKRIEINQPWMREKAKALCILSSKTISQRLEVQRIQETTSILTKSKEQEAQFSILNSCQVRMSLLGY